MSVMLLTMLSIAAPPEGEIATDAKEMRTTIRMERPIERDDFRTWYRALAARTTKRSRSPADAAVPELVAMHELVGRVSGFSAVERQRMRATLRGRIAWYGHRLRSRVIAARRETGPTAAGGDPSLVGAYSLIDLIQRTVNPPIWDVNGGPAGIGYFAPYHALVVRAPGEVHHQLGDTLGALRGDE